MQPSVENIHWLGHDSFRIEVEGKILYIDPWRLAGGPKADLILITHDHPDHCSPEDVAKIQKEDTVIITVEQAAAKLQGDIRVVKPGDVLTLKNVQVRAVPAYNVNKFRSPGVLYHPPQEGYVGFLLKAGEQTIYHSGDSDHIPEMNGLEVDIALLPVSGTYVMTVKEAIAAAATIQPKVAIPMHIGAGIGALEMASHFKEQATVPVIVLPQEK